MVQQHRAGWLHARWDDVVSGDTVRLSREQSQVNVLSRTSTPFSDPQFSVRLSDGRSMRVGKLSRVEILDADGRVAERILGYKIQDGVSWA